MWWYPFSLENGGGADGGTVGRVYTMMSFLCQSVNFEFVSVRVPSNFFGKGKSKIIGYFAIEIEWLCSLTEIPREEMKKVRKKLG